MGLHAVILLTVLQSQPRHMANTRYAVIPVNNETVRALRKCVTDKGCMHKSPVDARRDVSGKRVIVKWRMTRNRGRVPRKLEAIIRRLEVRVMDRGGIRRYLRDHRTDWRRTLPP